MGRPDSARLQPSQDLLGPTDPPPFEILNGAGASPFVFACDHASVAVPHQLNQLGVPAEAFATHVASDLGAAELTRRLSARLDAAAVLCGYSRLLIDCNRYLADPSSFRDISDGYPVPANVALSEYEKDRRIAAVRIPYHDAISSTLAARKQAAFVPALIAIHSFTPSMDGIKRPWQIGVLWDRDPRLALPALKHLNEIDGLCVGDNMPYSGRHPADYTIDHHAEAAGLPCLSLEVRQDLLGSEDGLNEWTQRLVGLFLDLAKHDEIFVVRDDIAGG